MIAMDDRMGCSSDACLYVCMYVRTYLSEYGMLKSLRALRPIVIEFRG